MKTVLHAPIEIAGQMGILCEGLRHLGWRANGYNWFPTYLKYNSPIVETDAYELQRVFDHIVRSADIIHYHNGDTMLPEYRDLPMVKELGKKLVMHHWGNDVRDVTQINLRQRHPLPPSYHTSQQIKDKLTTLSQFIDNAIIQDHELLEFVKPYYKRVFVLPLAVDTSKIPPNFPTANTHQPLVVHAPTNDEFKGTKYIEATIAALRTVYPFQYQRIEQMDHDSAMNWYAKADIVIDQVLCGTYGLLSVEAMAMGKPVVTYIRDDLKTTYPGDLPIVSANPDTLYNVMAILLADPQKRRQLGQEGRRYVERYHDIRPVAKQLADIYRQISE